jgi:hypothetical protein
LVSWIFQLLSYLKALPCARNTLLQTSSRMAPSHNSEIYSNHDLGSHGFKIRSNTFPDQLIQCRSLPFTRSHYHITQFSSQNLTLYRITSFICCFVYSYWSACPSSTVHSIFICCTFSFLCHVLSLVWCLTESSKCSVTTYWNRGLQREWNGLQTNG